MNKTNEHMHDPMKAVTCDLDPDGTKYDLSKAKKSCRGCHGTGIYGKMHMLAGARLVCACVVRKTLEEKAILAGNE